MSIYRKIYEHHYGPIGKDEYGRPLEIHHIDGNHSNNDIINLKLVTVEEHYDIHYAQGDWAACVLISAQRLNKSEKELKTLYENLGRHNSKILKQKVSEGVHHWCDPKHKENCRKNALKRVQNGTNPFLYIGKEQIKKGTHNFQLKWTCEHCKKTGTNQINLIRWHGNNCKQKP